MDLARRGYFRTEKWHGVIDGTIPAGIPGDGDDVRRANYEALLAAQVRISFPTQSIAEMVRSGDLPLTEQPQARDAIHAFLSDHQASFVIGVQPVEQYVIRNGLVDAIDPT